ncbi:MAG: insulinase family protein [Candidatus Nomurabacteria bacterium]|nr:insulinase family protein [Candidatus Nomurabacteria bacterium]USN87935.1 MAG: insulinase family protein [Candidatus Nomurabacteria bacterium]
MEIKTQSYSNFECATVEKDTPVVSVLVTVDCHDNNSARGVITASVYSDLLLSGAGKYSREDFLRAVDELGSGIEVGASEGRVTISVKSLEQNLTKTLSLLETVLIKPTFSKSEYDRAVKTAKNSLSLYKEEARLLAQDGLRRSFYGENDRHYRFTPKDLEKAFSEVSLADVKKLHEEFMTLPWVVSIGGKSTAIKTVLKLVQKIKKKTDYKPLEGAVSVKSLKGSRLVTEVVASKQNIELSIGGHLPLTMSDAELAPFTFGLAVLGKWGSFAGRLMSTVREKEGLTYSIYGRVEGVSKIETGYWRIMTFFAPKDVVQGVSSTLREIKNIHYKGITDSEWKRFKDILRTGETLVQDSLFGTVGYVHSALVAGVRYEDYKKYREQLYTCTKAEVNKVLKKYLNPANVVISAAGPVDKKIEKELKAVLGK